MTTSPAESSQSRINLEPYLMMMEIRRVGESTRFRVIPTSQGSYTHQKPRAKVLNIMKYRDPTAAAVNIDFLTPTFRAFFNCRPYLTETEHQIRLQRTMCESAVYYTLMCSQISNGADETRGREGEEERREVVYIPLCLLVLSSEGHHSSNG